MVLVDVVDLSAIVVRYKAVSHGNKRKVLFILRLLPP